MTVSGLEIKGTLALPAWQTALLQHGAADGVGNSQLAFNRVPLIFRAVQLRCNALSSIPIHVYKGETEVDWPFPQSLKRWIWQQEAALLLAGASFTLKKANSVRLGGIQWLNPFTVTVELTKEDAPTELGKRLRFTQQTQGGTFGPWTDEDIVYLREFDPMNDVGKGTASAAVALGNAQLIDYMTRFAGQFFASGAMPVVALGITGSISPKERERIENFFKRAMTGIKNAFRVVAVGNEIKATVITPPIKDLAWPDLSSNARSQVALAFGIPQTMLEDAANYATAVEHRMSFYEETVNPRGDMLEEAINTQLFGRLGYTIKFCPEEMSIFQEDETARAASMKTLVDAGLTVKLAMEILGYDLSEEQWAQMEGREKPVAVFSPFGADPKEKKPKDDEEMPPEMVEPKKDVLLTVLRQWREKALKRVKEGKSTKGLDFTHEVLPGGLRAALMGTLEAARTADEVKAAFANAGLFDPEVGHREMDGNALLKALTQFATSLPAPIVNVAAPPPANVTVEAPVVNVSPAAVKVSPPEVKVTNVMPKMTGRREHTEIKRGRDGAIVSSDAQVEYEYE